MNIVRRWFASRREQAYLIRSHTLLVDEALEAHRNGAPLAWVQTVYVGGHRRDLTGAPSVAQVEAPLYIDHRALEA